ncbi:hypothetical protein C4J87_3361 [Pseudomonas sp. R1-43-08]|nr:hypothetical protein C4J88_3618 [Pseudomonas sp. R4-39-08]AZF43504.1 hypothetical protein C4J87_3361 [Pseudomonas sp. R1-43-08]
MIPLTCLFVGLIGTHEIVKISSHCAKRRTLCVQK